MSPSWACILPAQPPSSPSPTSAAFVLGTCRTSRPLTALPSSYPCGHAVTATEIPAFCSCCSPAKRLDPVEVQAEVKICRFRWSFLVMVTECLTKGPARAPCDIADDFCSRFGFRFSELDLVNKANFCMPLILGEALDREQGRLRGQRPDVTHGGAVGDEGLIL